MLSWRAMKQYDQEYFDKWYRRTETKVTSHGDLRRKVAMVLGIAEELLQREVRSVLDVGCGEARWFPELKRMRSRLEYVGIDASEYAVARFGRSRNVRLGTFGGLADQRFASAFDLIVCADVMHYLSAREIDRGLEALVDCLDGVAYLSVFTTDDEPAGDLTGWHSRSAKWYRDRFKRYGLVPCGMQCYAGPLVSESAAALEVFR